MLLQYRDFKQKKLSKWSQAMIYIVLFHYNSIQMYSSLGNLKLMLSKFEKGLVSVAWTELRSSCIVVL
jgi:hypothetical protein